MTGPEPIGWGSGGCSAWNRAKRRTAVPPYRLFSLTMFNPNDSDRRGFLKGALDDWLQRLLAETEERVVVRRYQRPPGALPEMAFLAACTRCGACLPVCPPHAIIKMSMDGGLAAGTPYIDARIVSPAPSVRRCPAPRSCPTGALTLPPERWAGYRLAVAGVAPGTRCVTLAGPRLAGSAPGPVRSARRALAMDEGGHPVIQGRRMRRAAAICVRACITTPSSFKLQLRLEALMPSTCRTVSKSRGDTN